MTISRDLQRAQHQRVRTDFPSDFFLGTDNKGTKEKISQFGSGSVTLKLICQQPTYLRSICLETVLMVAIYILAEWRLSFSDGSKIGIQTGYTRVHIQFEIVFRTNTAQSTHLYLNKYFKVIGEHILLKFLESDSWSIQKLSSYFDKHM